MYMKHKTTKKCKYKHIKNNTLRKIGGAGFLENIQKNISKITDKPNKTAQDNIKNNNLVDNTNKSTQGDIKNNYEQLYTLTPIINDNHYETSIYKDEINKIANELKLKKERIYTVRNKISDITTDPLNNNKRYTNESPSQNDNSNASVNENNNGTQTSYDINNVAHLNSSASNPRNIVGTSTTRNKDPATQSWKREPKGGGELKLHKPPNIKNMMNYINNTYIKSLDILNVKYSDDTPTCNFKKYIYEILSDVDDKRYKYIIQMLIKIFVLNDYLYDLCQFQPCNISLENITMININNNNNNIFIPYYNLNTKLLPKFYMTPTISYVTKDDMQKHPNNNNEEFYIRMIYEEKSNEEYDDNKNINKDCIDIRRFYDIISNIEYSTTNIPEYNIKNNNNDKAGYTSGLITYIKNSYDIDININCDDNWIEYQTRDENEYSNGDNKYNIEDTTKEAYNTFPLNGNDYYNIAVLRMVIDYSIKYFKNNKGKNYTQMEFDKNKFYNIYLDLLNDEIKKPESKEIKEKFENYKKYVITPFQINPPDS